MKLQNHRDLWTNKPDYWWTLDGKVISPYFSNQEDAILWKEENESDYSCNGTDVEYLPEWDAWKANKDVK
jgi:coproporphyrinogen III oxidase